MLWKKPVFELRDLILKKEVKVSEVLESFIERFSHTEDKVRAFITPLYEEALKEAKSLDGKVEDKPLFGIPVAIKDNINVKGVRTTCASKMLENYVSVYDATVIEKLKLAGALIVGKTNMDEFAMGSSTEYSAFFPTRNPWDLERVPGGSSGGSAVSVAVFSAPLSLGSDTGGSIRQPASFCGVIGLKPTYGRVSRYGLVAFASSLDQIGPFGRRTQDVALLMEVISGQDMKDSTSAQVPVPKFSQEIKKEAKGLRIGIPKEFFEFKMEQGVIDCFKSFLKELEAHGYFVEEVSLPHVKYSIPAYYVIAPSEASSNLARYDGVRYGYRASNYSDLFEMYARTRDEGFGSEVKRRIMLGTFALSSGYYDAYYLKAMKVRSLIKRDFDQAFEKVDILASPTSPTVAFRLGEKTSDPIQMYLSDIFTVSVNLAGLPAISIPIGMSSGLPVGGQLIGKPFDEVTLLRVSYLWEHLYRHYEFVPLT
ncbi:Asp-tRNA(Asn)/Glu-tRNA(Gln) amidotransferase subunit GatA [Hydrogenobacter thermophilus]|uniref:Asp-tRNA(Asn)/Glu-tRNA(Gln) amidotransferase subunit GatA n=1 Tax=Hydrogenobacter thermophilus TaxID=940 RepID=UPI0030F6822C